jgi:Protein of unknown function (DUF1194)
MTRFGVTRTAGRALGLAISLGAVAVSPARAAAPQQVDLKLVLATDVSGSIDDDELQLERQGTADAFLDPNVVNAIQNGSLGRIAVAMIDFSMSQYNKVVIDWHIIHDRASAAQFADIVRHTPRTLGHRTAISSALETGMLILEASDKDIVAQRKVIDVSGDGPNNAGDSLQPVHDRTVAAGLIINGLPVMDEMSNGYFPNLDKYYAACVAGGPGSFVVVVRSYKDFAAGMRRKLVLEVSQNGDLPAKAAELGAVRVIPVAAPARTPTPGRPQGPNLLQSGRNEFTNNCDVAGGAYGFGFGGFGRF